MDNFSYPYEIELDSQGVVVAGEWYGTAVGAAFTSDGLLRWCVNAYSVGYASVWGLAVDSSDNVIVIMDRYEGGSDVGFAMLDTNGNLVRQIAYTSSSPDEYSWDVMVGLDGYIYCLGWSISESL